MQVEHFLHPTLHTVQIIVGALFYLVFLAFFAWAACAHRTPAGKEEPLGEIPPLQSGASSSQGTGDGEVIVICFAVLFLFMAAGFVYEIVHPTKETPASLKCLGC